ncbi:hypothetical protein KW850_03340 [Bacillus sp. sid0103]|uniref:hypothetical protein n=1 Tax=Bacillus sp. sid0103 TaxID=2856337 RepID=UPI001C48A8F9|nr:hypothetical protein [Bacillus sp. sid0103]MBV7504300.1 hypothetical protein [Bacillus sp. sid0103]
MRTEFLKKMQNLSTWSVHKVRNLKKCKSYPHGEFVRTEIQNKMQNLSTWNVHKVRNLKKMQKLSTWTVREDRNPKQNAKLVHMKLTDTQLKGKIFSGVEIIRR